MNALQKAAGWLAYKTVLRLSGPASDWYARNGYEKLAASYAGDNAAGVCVTHHSALRSTAVYACVKIISEDVGSLPLFLYRRTRDGREKAFREPLYRVLHDAPNDETSAVDLRGAMTAHACLTGDGYARVIRRASDDKTIGLYLLQPDRVRTDRTAGGKLVYLHKEGKNEAERTYQVRDILHLRGFGWDGVHGFDAVSQFRQAIGLSMSAEQYASKYFSEDATPSLVLKNPQKMGPEEVKLQKHAFLEAMGRDRIAVTHSGIEVEKISNNPEESQLIGQRVFQLLEVCRVFRMPPHKLAELSRATFSNIEQQAIEYYTQTLRPWLVRWEQAITRSCIDSVEDADLFAEHAIEGLLRGDFKTQTDGFARLLAAGVYSINEVRAHYNLNPIEGGDVHFIQINMGDITNVANDAVVESEQPQPQIAAPPEKRAGLFRVRELLG